MGIVMFFDRLENAEPASLDELLAASDIVSLHAPVTDETRGLIDATRLARMKPGAYLVNIGRGEVIDERAMAAALSANKIGGAGLDVSADLLPRQPMAEQRRAGADVASGE